MEQTPIKTEKNSNTNIFPKRIFTNGSDLSHTTAVIWEEVPCISYEEEIRLAEEVETDWMKREIADWKKIQGKNHQHNENTS